MPLTKKFEETLYNRDWLQKVYAEEHRNAAQVAALIGCNRSAVLDALRRFAIPVKTLPEVIRTRPPSKGSRADRPRAEFLDTLHNAAWLEERYVRRGMTATDIAEEAGCSITSACRQIKRQFDLGSVRGSSFISQERKEAGKARSKARRIHKQRPCMICGGTGTLNHIDANPENNEATNVEWLCLKHHLMVDKRLGARAVRWFRDNHMDKWLEWHTEVLADLGPPIQNVVESRPPLSEAAVDGVYASLKEVTFPTPAMSSETQTQLAFYELMSVSTRLDEQGVIAPYSLTGIAACASFFPNRYHARYKGSLSAVEAWYDEKSLRKAIQLQLGSGHPVTPERVLKAILFHQRTPSVFRPAVAKYVYETYAKGGVVWDPCAGYGGRLMGAMAAGVGKYIGTDVDHETVEGNRLLAEQLKSFSKCDLYEAKAETFDPEQALDLVFTSPPYYDLEVYGEDAEVEYGTVVEWLEDFLEPIMSQAYKSLKTGGHLVLNLPDKPVQRVNLVLAAKSIAETLGFEGCPSLGMPIRQRNRSKSRHKLEPILVWQRP